MGRFVLCLLLILGLTCCLALKQTTATSASTGRNQFSVSPFGLMLNVPGMETGDWEAFQRSLDEAAAMGVRYARLVLKWQWIEPEDDRFVWDGGSGQRVAAVEARGMQMLPVIKIGRSWASGFKPPERGDLSVPPLDLSETRDEQYGYSKSYYDFVYHLVDHWLGHFPVIVIENEANADNFWAGTADEYLRILATAYKAVHDADPEALVADSGIASGVWGVCIARDRLDGDRWSDEEVLAFLQSYYRHMPAEYLQRFATTETMRAELYSPRLDELYAEVTAMLAGLDGIVDLLNLHFYEDYWHLVGVLQWIDEQTAEAGYTVPDKLCNEYGIRDNDPAYDRLGADQAHELFKKLVVGLRQGLETLVWFSSNEANTDKTSLLSEGFVWREAAYTYQLMMEKIGANYTYDHSQENAGVQRHVFRHRTTGAPDLEAIWAEGLTATVTLPLPTGYTGARVTDYLGNECQPAVHDGQVTLHVSSSPVFLEWLAETFSITTDDGLSLTLSEDGQVVGLAMDGESLLITPGPILWVRDMSAAGQVSERNLLTNPGFEYGETGWRMGGQVGTLITITATVSHSGFMPAPAARVWTLNGSDIAAFNDVGHLTDVMTHESVIADTAQSFVYPFPAHSATLIELVKERRVYLPLARGSG